MNNLINEEIIEKNGIKFKKLDNDKYIPLNHNEAIKFMKLKFKNDDINSSSSTDLVDYEEYKKSIHSEKEYKKSIHEKIINETIPKKGKKNKEIVNIPMPTHSEVLKNKNISLKTYASFMLESNWGGKLLNHNNRYIYNDKFNEVIKELIKETKLSEKTIRDYVNKLKKCNIKIFEPITTQKGEIFYRLNYSDENDLNYTLIHDKVLKKLSSAYNENTLRIYLIMLYKCFVKINDDKTIEYKECELTQEYLCLKIGLSVKSRKIVTYCIEALARGGFIKVRVEYKTNYETKNNKVLNYPIPRYFYSIDRAYMKNNYIQKTKN